MNLWLLKCVTMALHVHGMCVCIEPCDQIPSISLQANEVLKWTGHIKLKINVSYNYTLSVKAF